MDKMYLIKPYFRCNRTIFIILLFLVDTQLRKVLLSPLLKIVLTYYISDFYIFLQLRRIDLSEVEYLRYNEK